MNPQRGPQEAPDKPGSIGFFAILVEGVAAVLAIAMGMLFLTTTGQPNWMAIILFVAAAVLVIDAVRRGRLIAQGRRNY